MPKDTCLPGRSPDSAVLKDGKGWSVDVHHITHECRLWVLSKLTGLAGVGDSPLDPKNKCLFPGPLWYCLSRRRQAATCTSTSPVMFFYTGCPHHPTSSEAGGRIAALSCRLTGP